MADGTKSNDIQVARTFDALLPRLDDGRFNSSVSDALRDLVAKLHEDAAARDGSSKGELKLTLALKLEDGVITVRADYGVKAPKETFAKSVFWATANNELTPENPKQEKFKFGVRQVEDAAPPQKLTEQPAQVRKV
jgi:hypothetical protein